MFWFLVILASLLFIYAIFIKPYKYWENKNVPHKRPIPILGNMARIIFRRTSFSEGIQDLYNMFNTRYFGLYLFMSPTLIIKDVNLLKQIGIKDFEYFHDHKTFVDPEIEPLFGKNLFQLKGQKWRHMRSTLSPAFTSSKMKSMFVLMSDCADQFTDYFVKNDKSDQHTNIDMKDIFLRYANDVIATCAFGIQCNSLTDRDNEFYVNGKRATDFSGLKGLKFFISSISPFLAKFLKIRIIDSDVTDFFRNVIHSNMQQREENGIYRPDLINLLMEAKKGKLKYEENVKSKDTGFATVEESQIGKEEQHKPGELTLDDLTAQAMLFFLAGLDSVSTLMCHMAHELAINPEIQERLQAEIDETSKNCKNGKITYDELTRMKYMDMVLCESLRKWPPAIFGDRVCTKTYTIDPVHLDENPLTINKGDQILILTYAFHRDPKHFPNPDKFDPERFSDENKSKINSAAYIPFGMGPRNCIGSRFALLEAKVMFFNLLSKMDFVVCEKTQLPIKLSRSNFNIVPENGFWLGFKPRNKKNTEN